VNVGGKFIGVFVDPIGLDHVKSIVIHRKCPQSSCRHQVTVVLEGGRSAINFIECKEIWLLISKVASDKINPNQEGAWPSYRVISHFRESVKESQAREAEATSAEAVLNGIFSQTHSIGIRFV
jgi:hypothetical protein